MNAENFCYWLQGFVELNGEVPTEDQWNGIKEHLQLVFKKETKFVVQKQPTIVPADNPQPITYPPYYEDIKKWQQPTWAWPQITCSDTTALAC